MPPGFAAALAAEPAARANFGKLALRHRRAHVDAIIGAKKDETRRRRIEKSIEMLRGDSGR
ncbi:MAG TPA: YdeI/OmpD-associated family protein [Actinophytocola sp.]|nr:YdeI/OmpD-associated family protein [Actinophytocola sp.]